MKTPLPAIEVCEIAEELGRRLMPFCERLKIAGSLRRRAPVVSDIELVMIPKITCAASDLFGNELEKVNHLLVELRTMRDLGELQDRPDINGRPAFGERFQRMVYQGIPVDLFSVLPPAEWGVIYLLRTGPADFNKRLVTAATAGGWMPAGMRIEDGRLLDRGQVVRTPEEADVFQAMGRPFIEPRGRR